MWRPSATQLSAAAFIFDTVVTRRGVWCALHKSLRQVRTVESRRGPVLQQVGPQASCRSVHVRVTDPPDARRPLYFGRNTNLEWMVLAARKRTPSAESIFRAGLRVRGERAVSAPRAATRPCRSRTPLPTQDCRVTLALRLSLNSIRH